MNKPNSAWQPSASLPHLQLRARLVQSLRAFFLAQDILEVETPLLSRYATTELHLQSFVVQPSVTSKANTYLPTSPELAMKRLLAAGSG